MNNKYFTDTESALQECDQLVKDDDLDSEDRATVSAFYNGQQTMTSCEADEAGVSELTNHLIGYDSIKGAVEQIFSIYSKSPTLFRLDVKNAPNGMEQRWSEKATKYMNEAIKHSGRFKPEFRSFSGEVTLFGSYHFAFCDNYDWCPKGCRPYAPRGTGTIPQDADYFAIREELSLKDLYSYRNRSSRLSKNGIDSGWNTSVLDMAIKTIEGTFSRQARSNPGASHDANITPEEGEYDAQMNTDNAERLRWRLPVYFLYTSRPDEKGCPFDMSILARYPVEVQKTASENHVDLERLLFDKERYYVKAPDFLHPFFVDCSNGGKTSWHRSFGLGMLNYANDVDTEKLFNDAIQGAKECMRRQYSVANSADTEAVNRWVSGKDASNVLPEGVTIVEQTRQANYQYAFQFLDFLVNESKTNASASIGNKGGSRATNELEVQALERQGRNAEAISSKMNDIYSGLDTLGSTITERFLNESVLPVDKGYAEIHYFQEKMKEEGIPIAFLRRKENNRFINIDVKVNRVAGDGDSVGERMVNQALMSRLHLFPPASQQEIIRRVTASETKDFDLAERLLPRGQEIDGGQVNLANNENQSCIQRGLTGYVPQLNRDDIHMIHLPEHFGGMQGLLAKGKAIGWDEVDMAGFQSILKHTMLHMQVMKANPANKEIATRMTQALQGMARQAQEFANNLQAKREAEQKGMDKKDLARLQLDGAKLELDERKQTALEEHRAKSLDLSRQRAGIQSQLQMRQQDMQSSQAARSDMIDIAKGQDDNAFRQLELEQASASQARGEVLSGERSSQGRAPQ